MKKLLFIAEPFYQYADKIKMTIEKDFNYFVDYLLIVNDFITDLSKTKKKSHFLNRKNNREIIDINRNKQEVFFKDHVNQNYDIILLLVFSGLCVDLFTAFIKKHNNTKKIMYLWDDVKRVAFFNDVKAYFDRIVSFDNMDCEKFGFEFLPLFYTDDYKYCGEEKIYDISTYGAIHTDREMVLKKIIKELPTKAYHWKAKFIIDRWSYLKDIIKLKRSPLRPFYIGFYGVSAKETADVLKRSKVVVDIPVPGQNGLTMRTLEALAANTKIITTNENIRIYDFYNSQNVEIIDRNNPKIKKGFVEIPYVPIEDEIVNKYSIRNWVSRLLDEEPI